MYPSGDGGAEPASPTTKETRGSFRSFPGLVRGSKNNKSASLVEKEDFIPGIHGTSLAVSSFSHQTPHTCSLESDFSAEKKFHSPEENIAGEGVLTSGFYKDHYNAAMEQLAALSLSKSARTSQLNSNSSKQAPFHPWSCIYNQGNNAVSRDFTKPFGEIASSSSDIPINFINTNPLVQSYMKRCHTASYPETQKTLENYFRNGDGDFFKKANEATASATYPAIDSSSDDMLSVIKLNLKRGNSNVEDKLSVEEKYISESEKRSKALLKYLKNVNLNLKPEPIEDKESISSSLESDTFSYPDFLPPPYNTMDLQKMSSLKLDDWKLSFNPPLEDSLDKLISRLVEMERLQHLTILKERTRESFSPAMAVNNRSSSKDVHQLKQLKPSDLSCPQACFDGDVQNFGYFVQELDIPKCTCQHCRKWNYGASSPVRSSTKHCRASCHSFKCSKAPVILDSSNVATRSALSCSGSSQKIRSAVKMTSRKLLLPSTAVAYSLPENESLKCKQPRTKRKSCKKNGALMSKPFHSQKLKSVSLITKQKCSHVDHQ